MYFARALFLATIAWAALAGRWNVVAFSAIIFALTLFLPWLGRSDPRYLSLDAYSSCVFAVSGIFILAQLNPLLNDGAPLGIDKIFHMAGGAGLAWLALILTSERLLGWRLGAAAIGVTIGLGLAWEVFELGLAMLPQVVRVENHGGLDTLLDLCADTIGGALAWALWRWRAR
jgi:hypothetical protein